MDALSWVQQQVNFYTDEKKLSEQLKINPDITYVMLKYLYRLAYSSEKEFRAELPYENQAEIQKKLCQAVRKSEAFSWENIGNSKRAPILNLFLKTCRTGNQFQALALIQSGIPISIDDFDEAKRYNCAKVVHAILEKYPQWLKANVYS